jgi:hypothetical protein
MTEWVNSNIQGGFVSEREIKERAQEIKSARFSKGGDGKRREYMPKEDLRNYVADTGLSKMDESPYLASNEPILEGAWPI